jgi:hypothetical protein
LGIEAALDDQRAAASLMWVGGMAITLPLLIVSVWRWAAAEERIAERAESARSDHALVEPRNRKSPNAAPTRNTDRCFGEPSSWYLMTMMNVTRPVAASLTSPLR